MLDRTDVADLIEDGEFTAQYTEVDGVARLVLGGRDDASADFVRSIFEGIEAATERVDESDPDLDPEAARTILAATAVAALRTTMPAQILNAQAFLAVCLVDAPEGTSVAIEVGPPGDASYEVVIDDDGTVDYYGPDPEDDERAAAFAALASMVQTPTGLGEEE